MIKSLIYQLKAHPLGSVFLILGYSICILAFSLGISYEKHTKEMEVDINNGYKEFNINKLFKFSDAIAFDKLNGIIDKASETSEIQLKDTQIPLNSNENFELNAISYTISPDWIIPILEGRYINKDEIKNGEKIAVIGSNINKYAYEKSKEKYIDIGKESFKVIGIAGRKHSSGSYENSVYIPFKAIPQVLKKQISEELQLNIYIKKNKSVPSSEMKTFTESIEQLDPNFQAQAPVAFSSAADNYMQNAAKKVLFILAVGIINVINLSVFWILDRKKEIAVKKTFGAGNLSISIEIFKEMFSLSLTGAIISMIFQYILDHYLWSIFTFSITPTFINFILVLLLSLCCGFVITCILFSKIVNTAPAEALNQ